MINGEYHVERKHLGKKIIIDIVEEHPGDYEGVVLSHDGDDIESINTHDFAEAQHWFIDMLDKYPESPKPLSGKYVELRDAIKAALADGHAAERQHKKDWGTCNFDSAMIELPRWRRKLVYQAAEEAGTMCFYHGQGWFSIYPRTNSQGQPRTDNAEAMKRSFARAGFKTGMWYQAD